MTDSSNSTSSLPQVLILPDRGPSAIHYIDVFDEGFKGPDNLYFVGRFQTIEEAKGQIEACLESVANGNPIIHGQRLHIPNKWIETRLDPNDPYPLKAQYPIRFLLRIKFYNDFAYVDLGKKWEPLYSGNNLNDRYPFTLSKQGEVNIDALLEENATPEEQTQAIISEIKNIKITDLEVISSCWISVNDANLIKDMIVGSSEPAEDEETDEVITDDDGTVVGDDEGNVVTA